MTRGRKPMPPHLKLMRGTHRDKKAAIDAGARVTGAIPEPPAWLADDAKTEWARVAPGLQALRLLTDLDVATFGAYCSAVGTWKQAAELLKA